jgi:hypothetical protein
MEKLDSFEKKRVLDTLHLQREILDVMQRRHKAWKDLTDNAETQTLYLEIAKSMQTTILLIDQVVTKL